MGLIEMEKKKVLITNLTTNNDAFGVDPETGEGVYIPPGVTIASKLIAGEERVVTLVANTPGRSTKYMGVFVAPVTPVQLGLDLEPEVELEPELPDILLEVLEDTETYLTTREVGKELGIETIAAREVLNKLFTVGKVARADIYFGSDKRAKNVLWATDPDKFL